MNKILLVALALFSTTTFAQTWVQKANAPVGRHHPISFSLNGKGYAVTGSLSNGQPTFDSYQYDPIADVWTAIADFPGSARSFGMGVVANGKAYVGFGATNTSLLNDLWRYDASDSSWTQLADCGCAGRRHPAMIAIGDRIYVGLGDNGNGNLRDWWMYNITTDTWTQTADLPGPVRHHPFMFNAGGEVFAGMGHGNGVIYKDWYKLDTATNRWTAMTPFPGEARVAGTQFSMNGYGFVLSGDGDNHSYMATGEMWRYNPNGDTWRQFPSHPGQSRWAPGSFVINDNVYFFGGQNRFTNTFPTDTWTFDMAAATVSLDEEVLARTFIYPNPANEFFSWENDDMITEVKVYNTIGQLITISPSTARRIETSDFNAGLYLVQFYSNDELIKTSKLLVKH